MHSVRSRRPDFAPLEHYYAYVAAGYDIVAESYDDVEGQNALSERVREAAIKTALRHFQANDLILELGCGTGRDAVMLAHYGIRVVATDVSRAMVQATLRRARDEGVSDLVEGRVLTAAQAAKQGGPYDGVYSNGAVLNLEPDLPSVAKGLARSLRPGGSVVFTIGNRISLFELFFYSVILRPRKAFRKLGSTVPIPISRSRAGKEYVVPTRFYSPREFLAIFTPLLQPTEMRGLQVFTPTWNLVEESQRFEGLIGQLNKVEDRWGSLGGLRALGAIYLVVMQRKTVGIH